MSVTDQLSDRDRELAAAIGDLGFLRPFLTVAAFRHDKADLKPQTALALLSKETGNGKMVFGCDWGRVGDRPPWCGHAVTEERYRALRKLGKANGVGSAQLTSFFLCDRADARGGCWLPYPNMLTGFERIRELFDEVHDLERAANRYNGGDSATGERNGAAAGYGDEFMRFREQHERSLIAAGFHVG